MFLRGRYRDRCCNIFECNFNKSANDTKLCGAVNALEGRDAIQGHLGRLERWACANLMKFNKAKCKVLHGGPGNLKQKYRLDGEWIESPEEKDLGVLVNEKLNVTRQCMFIAQKANHGLHQKKCGQKVEGGDSALLLYSDEIQPGVPASSSGVLSTGVLVWPG